MPFRPVSKYDLTGLLVGCFQQPGNIGWQVFPVAVHHHGRVLFGLVGKVGKAQRNGFLMAYIAV